MRARYRARRGRAAPVGLTSETIEVGGLARQYWCAPMPVPDGEGDTARAPLLIALHGAGGQGPGMASLTGLHRRGPAAGFVTIFPDGVGRVWNDSRGAQGLRRREQVDDVAFLQSLVARFAADGRARGDGVYLCGISNGAFMSEYLARHGLVPVAGVALVAGPGTQTSRAAMARPAQPVTVVIFAGTADPLVPYRGGPIGPLGRMVQRRGGGRSDRGLAVAAEDAAADWAAANGIASAPIVEPVPTPPGDLPVTRMTWQAPSRPAVTLYRIDGGGHTWPDGAQYLPARFIRPTAQSLDATGILLEQFRTRDT
jgi:polyhydroxybutyrate depolymerase